MDKPPDKPLPLLVTVLGPTASGKTAFAARLALAIDAEIISADSRQVYRKMDIGTGKDYEDYRVDGTDIPYHLVDIVDAGYKYSLFEYQRDFVKAFNDIAGRGKRVILCGGSGMYIESVLQGYELVAVPHNEELRRELESRPDEELKSMLASMRKLHNVSDTSSRKRLIRAIEIEVFTTAGNRPPASVPEFDYIIFGIAPDRDTRRRRITGRLEARLGEGMIDEVRQLLDEGLQPEDLIFYGLEYKYVTLYLTGKMKLDEMKQRLNTAIHQFAKRQMTWFRKMERSGYEIHWLDPEASMEEKLQRALSLIS
jgi:tRNA dimethylallyltransferase